MSTLASAFVATLESSLAGLSGLVAILREEKKALTGHDAEALEQIVKQKVVKLKEVELSVMARERILQQANCGSGIPGGERFIRQHCSSPDITQDWAQLKQLSAVADELNTHNAQLAFAGEHTTRQALSILTGRSQEKTTYSRGKQHKTGGGISLGKC